LWCFFRFFAFFFFAFFATWACTAPLGCAAATPDGQKAKD
jgi:hypothetical protein